MGRLQRNPTVQEDFFNRVFLAPQTKRKNAQSEEDPQYGSFICTNLYYDDFGRDYAILICHK